jgi:hypothetical protein
MFILPLRRIIVSVKVEDGRAAYKSRLNEVVAYRGRRARSSMSVGYPGSCGRSFHDPRQIVGARATNLSAEYPLLALSASAGAGQRHGFGKDEAKWESNLRAVSGCCTRLWRNAGRVGEAVSIDGADPM